MFSAAEFYLFDSRGKHLNWIFFVEGTIAGLLAGYASWLVAPAGISWNVLLNFQTTILTVGVFSGVFTGIIYAIPHLSRERRLKKFLGQLLPGTSVGLAIPMLGGVVYTIFAEIVVEHLNVPGGVVRFFWWLLLSILISTGFGILNHSLKIMCRTMMGLIPSFLISGVMLDKIFLPHEEYLKGALFIGVIIAVGYVVSWELLKDAWLEEEINSSVTFRYFIDSADFIIGSSDNCDLSLEDGPEQILCISCNDGVHALDVLAEEHRIVVNSSRIRHRVLVDGDVISIGNRKFVYHSKLARSRDIIPEAFA